MKLLFQSFLLSFFTLHFSHVSSLLSPLFLLLHFLHSLSYSSVACRVPVIVGHLNELVDHIQQIVVVFVQQPLVQGPVPEAHLHQHSHHGVLGGGVHRGLQSTKISSVHKPPTGFIKPNVPETYEPSHNPIIH